MIVILTLLTKDVKLIFSRVTEGAVRKRLAWYTLKHERDEDGRVLGVSPAGYLQGRR